MYLFSAPHYGWTRFIYGHYIDKDFLVPEYINNKKLVLFSNFFRVSYLTNLPDDMYNFLRVSLLNNLDNKVNLTECKFDAEGWEWKFKICFDNIFLVISGDMIIPQKFAKYGVDSIPDFIIPLNVSLEQFVDNWIYTLTYDLDRWIEHWNFDNEETSNPITYSLIKEKYEKQIKTLSELNAEYKKKLKKQQEVKEKN